MLERLPRRTGHPSGRARPQAVRAARSSGWQSRGPRSRGARLLIFDEATAARPRDRAGRVGGHGRTVSSNHLPDRHPSASRPARGR
ncbi:hypothetical protein ACRAWD_04610 [Caulobacter segnis]